LFAASTCYTCTVASATTIPSYAHSQVIIPYRTTLYAVHFLTLHAGARAQATAFYNFNVVTVG